MMRDRERKEKVQTGTEEETNREGTMNCENTQERDKMGTMRATHLRAHVHVVHVCSLQSGALQSHASWLSVHSFVDDVVCFAMCVPGAHASIMAFVGLLGWCSARAALCF